MTSENFVHIKLEKSEALQVKRDILSSEMALLKTMKFVKAYYAYRIKELEVKLGLYKKIKELKLSMGSLQRDLPKVKIPEILKKEEQEKEKVEKKEEVKTFGSIDEQLHDIQRKLDDLQRM